MSMRCLLFLYFLLVALPCFATQAAQQPFTSDPSASPTGHTPQSAPAAPAAPVTPSLALSSDNAINKKCDLTSVKASLSKEKDPTKRAQLIKKFNDCVKLQERPIDSNGTLSEHIVIGVPESVPPPPPPTPGAAPEGPRAPGAIKPEAAQGADQDGAAKTTTITPSTQQQYTQGEQLTGSAWGTPDACATGTPASLAAKGILFVHRSLVLPQEATDDFGYRLGKRFMVYQVSITNASADFQYSVSDIVVNLKPIFKRLGASVLLNSNEIIDPDVPPGKKKKDKSKTDKQDKEKQGAQSPQPAEPALDDQNAKDGQSDKKAKKDTNSKSDKQDNLDQTDTPTAAAWEASSQDLSMLRGVPEKGQDYDPRNMTLHIFQGIGAVGAGVSGLTPFSNVMGSAMANFNGAFLQAFTGIAPDHTANQLNRLSDKAFTSGTLIGKLQTKTFAIFIPEQFIMPKTYVKAYWKDPRTLLNSLPFDQLNVCVDGILLVQAATTPDPTFSTKETNLAPTTPISLSDSASTATIYYTTNGDTPTTSSSKYSTPIPMVALGAPTLVIKAFAVAPNQSPSNTVTASFTPADPAKPPTVICPAVNSATITLTTPGDTIFYTEDGTTPTRASTAITATTPFTPKKPSETITAVEVGTNTSLSAVKSATCPSK